MALLADANCRYSVTDVRTMLPVLAEVGAGWLEEPFPPSQHASFAELHRRTTVPLSAGEHLYDRDDVLPFLREGTLGVLQTDPEWCGGVTELVRICGLAETFGVPVIPHGHGLHAALHVVASQSPGVCPMAEYLMRSVPALSVAVDAIKPADASSSPVEASFASRTIVEYA